MHGNGADGAMWGRGRQEPARAVRADGAEVRALPGWRPLPSSPSPSAATPGAGGDGVSPRSRAARTGRAGFSLIELLLVVVVFSITVGVGIEGFRQFNESATVDRAARVVAGDVVLARTHAIQRREHVSLVADEADRSYAIVDASGDTILVRRYNAASDLPLTLLDVKTSGDDLTFNARGLLASGSAVEIDVGRLGKEKRVQVSVLGRTTVEAVS